MISFIVIGKNESKTLSTCLKSIFNTIRENAIEEYEVLYIDSNSNDGSIEIAKSFKNIQIFKIFKNESAAAGRNIGASNAKGEYLFFVDGDMILHPGFLTQVINEQKDLIYDFVTGEFIYHLLNKDGEVVREVPYYTINVKEKAVLDSNGCFIIKKQIWKNIGGMDIRFRGAGSEDYDFFLNGRNKGYALIRINKTIAEHYILPYENPLRQWKDLFNGRQLLKRAFLWRKNIFNKYMYYLFFRQEYSLLALVVSLILVLATHSLELLLVYLGVIVLRGILKSLHSIISFPHFVLFYIVRDFGVFFTCFLYNYQCRNPLYTKIQ